MGNGWRDAFVNIEDAIHSVLADAFSPGSMSSADFLKLAGLPASALATAWAAGFELVPTANWSPTTVRTFLLDPVNGSDSNVGYSDAAGPYNPATQAKQTIAGLKAVLPVAFAGRKFRLIMAAGTYTDGLDKLLGGASGIGTLSLVRGTATNTTANATAFSDDANDRIYQGWATATGMNAAGYNPTGAPTTTVIQCLKVGAVAPAFGAEPALPLGARIRFDAATTTAALRNICRVVQAVTGTDTLTLDSALPAVPVAGDVFYLEMGGLSLPVHTLALSPTGSSSELQLCGLNIPAGGFLLGAGDFTLAGVFCGSLAIGGSGRINQQSGFVETTTSGSVTIGGCMRSEAAASYQRCSTIAMSAHVALGTTTFFGNSSTPSITGCFVCAGSVAMSPNGNTGLLVATAARVIAPGTGLGNLTLAGQWQIGGLALTNAGAKPAMRMTQASSSYISFANAAVTGSTGNNDVGLDVSAATGTLVLIGTVPTVTGALGDVRVAGGAIITWAQALAGYVDANGNRFVSAGVQAAHPTALPALFAISSAAFDLLSTGALTTLAIPNIGGGKLFKIIAWRLDVVSTTGAGPATGSLTIQLTRAGVAWGVAGSIAAATFNADAAPASFSFSTAGPTIDPSVANALQYQVTAAIAGFTTASGKLSVIGYYE